MAFRSPRLDRPAFDAAFASAAAMLRGEGWSRMRSRLTVALVVLGPILAILTAVALGRGEGGLATQQTIRGVFLLDLVYILVVAGLVIWRVAALIAARREQSAGSRLHLRLTGVFTLIALAPTILVAVFATLTVSFGIEGWFSTQIGTVVRNSLHTARAYEQEHRRAIRGEVLAMANDLNRAGARGITDGELGELLRAQARLRNIPEAYIFDSNIQLRARGEFSYLFSFDPPSDEELSRARNGEVVIVEDNTGNQIRALVYLTNFFDYYLYVSRRVDGDVLKLLDETTETVTLYERLERDRDSILLEFALLYLGFALLVILAAIWLGLWFAERLARPIGRLAGAAQRVGSGDLDVRVIEEPGDDEIAVLSRVFNRMTEQVKGQRDALVAVNQETERRRRFIEAVLTGVTAGVMRLDPDGRIVLINEAAARMLGIDLRLAAGAPLGSVAPIFAPLFDRARASREGAADARIHGLAGGRDRDILARIARTKQDDASDGYVLTFDDMTELVSAQRMAAWGDIARRIAHEIKNPLTPIQLSAERLKAKFGKGLEGREKERFDSYADMIVRQAGDIRRMVDEFSRFARMPAPELADHDLSELLREAVLLQNAADTGIAYEMTETGPPRRIRCDRGLIAQALTNLLKNAGEAVEARLAERPTPPGRVIAELVHEPDADVVRIIDNGVGLPVQGRSRLLEPYVTTREKGTGLGLAIVKKIIEEHGGTFVLDDAPQTGGENGENDGETPPRGAMAAIRLPAAGAAADGADRSPNIEQEAKASHG